ncbi:hypothetical protein [Gudongella oleilytica]|uniref:hypothetical protein n=1 Tax=Gudongella oleilytica TaxID=1582259 RepID=UPI002A35BA2D|nr:hypothetical protein [Gudongella oleilytica]
MELYEIGDEDTSLNQLLELLKSKDENFIESLNESIDLDLCTPNEIEYLTKISAIIDYSLQLIELKVPDWLRDDRLEFDKPYFHSKRISDFDKFKLQFSSPAPFRARNVYFDLNGLIRV